MLMANASVANVSLHSARGRCPHTVSACAPSNANRSRPAST
jgi:hypothetical protein